MLRRIIAKPPLCPHTIADAVQKIPTMSFFSPGWLRVLHRDGSYWNKLPFIQVYITILALYLSVLIILSPSSTAYISMLSIWVLWLLYQRAQTSYQLFWICPFFIPSLALLDSVAWQSLETYQSLYIAEVIYLGSQTFSSCLSSLGSLNHFHFLCGSPSKDISHLSFYGIARGRL